MLTLRATLNPGNTWSAICSGCPLWHVDHERWGVYRSAVLAHTRMHTAQGQRVMV